MCDQERVAITFTLFSDSEFQLHSFVEDYLPQIAEQLSYKILSYTSGMHVQSPRAHFHVCSIFSMEKNSKKYKVLNEKIRRICKSIFAASGDESALGYDIQISYLYEHETKIKHGKKIRFDENFVQYAFKEYEKDEQINLAFQYGYTEEQLYAFRLAANQIWKNIMRQRQQEEDKKELEQKQEANLEVFLDENLEKYDSMEFRDLVRVTILHIVRFKKQEHQKIRHAALKDIAFNYLLFNNRIDEQDIVDYIMPPGY